MDSIPDPKIEQAWQAARDHLHAEMSRAWFDSWVKPAFLVNFNEDCFNIGCVSSYQRDWLTDRLTSTLERFLTGTLNHPVKVRFVFDPCSGSEGPDESTIAEDEEDNTIELEVLYHSIRETLVEPGRVVRLPVYYLRWLPYVGAQTIFLVMALWQEYYLSHEGKSGKGIPKVNVRAERICRWAGISRAQFFRLTRAGSPMGWFAQKSETDHEIDRRTGRAKKSANKYSLFNLPFTPGDAIDLTHYLVTHDFQNSPEDALRSAIACEPKVILQYSYRSPPKDFHQVIPHRITVQETIRRLAGQGWNTEISDLADRLAERLTGQGEFILVSWYFLIHWLPMLGPNAAMLILVLRNLCYFNDETGEIRDEVWIDDGYEGIAARLGMNNPQLIATWFPSAIERKKSSEQLTSRTSEEYDRRIEQQQLLGHFLRRIDHRRNASGSYSWKFKVERTDPLTPADEAIQRSVTDLIERSKEKDALAELFAWVDRNTNHCFETLNKVSNVDLILSSLTNGCSETLKILLDDCFETHKPVSKDCFETHLKILKNIKESQIDQDTSSTQDSVNGQSDQKAHPVVVAAIDLNGNWSLEKLLVRADAKNRHSILSEESCPIPLVSWLIYGVSQPGIQNPLSLAISKLRGNPKIGAGGACERLATLSPICLAKLIEQAFGWNTPTDPDWRMLFGQVSRDRIRLLADLLSIDQKTLEG